MDVAVVQELPADRLAGATLEENVVGDDYASTAVYCEQRLDVLDEIELLVRGSSPEVVAPVGLFLFGRLAVLP